MEETEKIQTPETEEVEESVNSEEGATVEETEKPEEETKKEKPVYEVIARKARGYFAALVFTLIFGVFMAIVGAIIVAVGIVEGGNIPMMYLVAAAMFLGGVGLVVYSALCMKRIRRIPQVVISREGDTVNFFVTKKISFCCKANEITNVSYFQSYGRGQTRPWGTLVIYFGEKELQLVYIKDVVAAHNRLFALMIEYKKTEEKKKPEKEATDNPEEITTESEAENDPDKSFKE